VIKDVIGKYLVVIIKRMGIVGIDELQCVFLCFIKLKEVIKEFEKSTNKKCEYIFFVGFER
jgi:hypothetical protein